MKAYKCGEQMDGPILDEIYETIKDGHLVIYPTETLYALGASPFDESAMECLFKAKKRPRNIPVPIALSSVKEMEKIAVLTGAARRICDRYLPGPLTLVLERKIDLPFNDTPYIGLRVPSHPLSQKLLERCGPLTTTSANVHGGKEPADFLTAASQLSDEVKIGLDSGPTDLGRPSTIVMLTADEAKVIREGVISSKEILEIMESEVNG